jgi:hypothetical protein
MEQSMQTLYPSDDFFTAEETAQAAAEALVDTLYRRAGEQRAAAAGVAVAAIATGVAVTAYAWKSQWGRKLRNKVAAAIKAE